MKPNLKNFLSLFDEITIKLIERFIDDGFVLTLVGGAVKEFIEIGELPIDLDFELRHTKVIKGEAWLSTITTFTKKLEQDYEIEILPFGIVRISIGELSIELASSRFEVFDNAVEKGHKDFVPTFASNISYDKAFKRRDLTINAIGLEIKRGVNNGIDLQVVDPFNGLKDFKEGILESCSDDFILDPVRFLRLIRFEIQHKFVFGDRVKKSLPSFNLKKLSGFYFHKEAMKVPFFKFVSNFYQLVESKKITINEGLKEISFLNKLGVIDLSFKNIRQVLSYLVINEIVSSREDIDNFVRFFQIKKGFLNDLIKLRDSLKKCIEIDFKKLKAEVEKLSLNDVFTLEEFNIINKVLSNRIVVADIENPTLVFLEEGTEEKWRAFLAHFSDWNKNVMDLKIIKTENIKKRDYWRLSLSQFIKKSN